MMIQAHIADLLHFSVCIQSFAMEDIASTSVVCADYVRLMKYGDSLYRCKELKRAALVCASHALSKLMSIV